MSSISIGNSLIGRTSINEPGKKALTEFISTVKPPLTLPITLPVTVSLSLKATSRSRHTSARFALSLDSLVSPKLSSTALSATRTLSPTLTVNSPLTSWNCPICNHDSDFNPESIKIYSSSIFITSASKIEPIFISTDVKLSSNNSSKPLLILISP